MQEGHETHEGAGAEHRRRLFETPLDPAERNQLTAHKGRSWVLTSVVEESLDVVHRWGKIILLMEIPVVAADLLHQQLTLPFQPRRTG